MNHHIGFTIAVYVFFGIGTLLNVLQHASRAVNSKLNGITTYGQYFRLNGIEQAFKSFIALCILQWGWHNEPALDALAHWVWSMLPLKVETVPGWFLAALSVNPATAGCYGCGWDVLAELAVVQLKKRGILAAKEVPPTLQTEVTKAVESIAAKS